MFEKQFFGLYDKNGRPIHEGDNVEFYYKGEYVICKIIYVQQWGMFCLQWPDGYKNKHCLNPDKYEIIDIEE